MKLNDICVSDDFKSDDDVTWKENIIKKKKYFKDFTNQFAEFFIFKFFELTKKTRLKFEQIQRMQIKNELRVFQSTMKFVQKNEFKLFRKNDLMTFVQFLRSTNSTKMFIAYKRKD